MDSLISLLQNNLLYGESFVFNVEYALTDYEEVPSQIYRTRCTKNTGLSSYVHQNFESVIAQQRKKLSIVPVDSRWMGKIYE